MASSMGKPSNYALIQKIRKAKKASLKPCSYLKPSTKLRDYQSIGTLHFLLSSRMILGDGVGLGKCINIESYIPTSQGLQKFKNLLPKDLPIDKFIENKGSYKVLTMNGLKKPHAIFYCGKKKGIKIVTENGYELEGLNHHPIYVVTKKGLVYKRLDELEKGSYVCIHKGGSFSENLYSFFYDKKEYFLKEIFGEFLGFYTLSGYVKGNSNLIIEESDPLLRQRILVLLCGIINEDIETYSEEGGFLKIHNRKIISFLRELSIKIKQKSELNLIPPAIMKSPYSVISSYLRVLFEKKGKIDKHSKMLSISINSALSSSLTHDFLKEVQLLLLHFDIVSELKEVHRANDEGYDIIYYLYIKKHNLCCFEKYVGFISDSKNVLISEIIMELDPNDSEIIPFGHIFVKEFIEELSKYIKGGIIPNDNHSKKLLMQLKKVDHKEYPFTYNLLDQMLYFVESLHIKFMFSKYDTFKHIQKKHFYFDQIKFIEHTIAHFADFSIPFEQHFISNGFISHNTIQLIASYAYRLVSEPHLKLLIITSKSAMEQWKEEFEHFCEGISVHVLSNTYGQIKRRGPSGRLEYVEEYGDVEELKKEKIKHKIISGLQARKAQYNTIDTNVIITNYHTVKKDYIFLIENRLPDYQVAFDECQEFKNIKTSTWFGAEKISSSAKYCYGLSATVIKNRLDEAYYIYQVIVPGIFPGKNKFFAEYTIRKKMAIRRKGQKRKQYFNKITGYKNLGQFREIIDPYFLARKTRDVASELPKLISRKLYLELTDNQRQLYARALNGDLYRQLIRERYFKFKDFITSKEDITEKECKIYEQLSNRYEESLTEEGLRKNKIAALSYCQLISNGPGWLNEEGASSKETEFLRLFDQELTYEKVIVYTRFKSGIKRLTLILDYLGLKSVKITGDDSTKERLAAQKKFQDLEQDYNVIFITQAGSAAINLQAASVILYYDTPWSYGDLYQSIGRAQRIGSIRENILIIHMVNKDTIDEHVLKILEKKKDLIGDVIGDIAEGALEFKKDSILDVEESDITELYNSVFN